VVALAACADDTTPTPERDATSTDSRGAAATIAGRRRPAHEPSAPAPDPEGTRTDDEVPSAQAIAGASLPGLLALLRHDDLLVRSDAHRRLRQLEAVDPRHLPDLMANLGVLDETTGHLIVSLGADAVEPLCEAARKDLYELHELTLWLLEKLVDAGHSARVLEVANRLAQDEDDAVVSLAFDAFVVCGDHGIAALTEHVEAGRGDQEQIRDLALVLGGKALPFVRAYLVGADESELGFALAAVRALDGRGDVLLPELERLAGHADSEIVADVAGALRGAGPAGLPLLGRLLDHRVKLVRVEAIRTIGDLGAPAAELVPLLLDQLRDMERRFDHDALVKALIQLGEIERVFAIHRERMSGPHPDPFDIWRLDELGESGKAFARRHLAGWLRSEHADVRHATVGIADEIDADLTQHVDALADLLTDPTHFVRWGAAVALEEVGPAAAAAAPRVAAAIERLKIHGPGGRDEMDEMRQNVELLASMGPAARPQLPLLMRLLREGEQMVSEAELGAAVIALGGVEDADAFELLEVRDHAQRVVLQLLVHNAGQLEASVVAWLWDVVGDGSGALSGEALRVLNVRHAVTDEDAERLLMLLSSDESDAREQVFRLVSQLAPELRPADPFAVALARHTTVGVLQDRRPAADALVHFGDEGRAAIPQLVRAAVHNSIAAQVLGGLGLPGLEPLVGALKDEPGAVQARVLTRFLNGMYRARDAWSPERRQATCRAWLQARFGPDWNADDAPLPKSADRELRWVVNDATRQD
jgi:HEAT repeat protein